jgi:hypothetical protein
VIVVPLGPGSGVRIQFDDPGKSVELPPGEVEESEHDNMMTRRDNNNIPRKELLLDIHIFFIVHLFLVK